MWRWLLVIAIGCGNSSSPPPAPEPAKQTHVTPRSPILDRTADHFAALADDVTDTSALAQLRDSLATIHQSAAYKKALPKASDYKPLDIVRVEQTIDRRGKLAESLQHAAKLLRSNKVLEAIEPVATDIDHFMLETISSSDIVDELAWVRDHACAKCDLAPLSHAFDESQAVGSKLRATLDTATSDLAALPLDVHTQVVLQRVSDRGPAFGQPCGPESLCGSGNTCDVQNRTCELACKIGAMQECPGGRTCTSVTAIAKRVCR